MIIIIFFLFFFSNSQLLLVLLDSPSSADDLQTSQGWNPRPHEGWSQGNPSFFPYSSTTFPQFPIMFPPLQILEEAVYRNIAAVKELSQVTRTSLGPNGYPPQLARLSWCGFHEGSVLLSLFFLFSLLGRQEQDDCQPPGQALCHQRCRHDAEGDGHHSPGVQGARAWLRPAAAGDW